MCLAVPGELLEVDNVDALPMGRVSFGGVVKEICLAYTPEAKTGDYVLAHAGFAISILDKCEATQRMEAFTADDPSGGQT
ncbi:MAG: HypC/HybG/HupF family hydrogenase formation chaperone [Pseudomonadota bacterium]